MKYICYILCIYTSVVLCKFNVPGTNICKKTSLELTDNNGEKINITAEKLSLTNHLCKMKNLAINFSDGCFSAEYGEIDPTLLSGYVSKNVSFKNNIIESSLNKIYINLSTKCFYTKDKVTSKIKNAIIKSDGIVYEKPKSKIIFLKNVRVQII